MALCERDKLSSFLFHLGKGIWKAVPFLGAIVDEVFYVHFEKQLKSSADTLSDRDLQPLSATVDLADFERRIGSLADEMRLAILPQYVCVLEDISGNHGEVLEEFRGTKEQLAPLPNILALIEDVRHASNKADALEQVLEKHENTRHYWINRMFCNQRLVLKNMSDDFVSINRRWTQTLRAIPSCGYKEFRFRLHELEWLGLIERERRFHQLRHHRRLDGARGFQ